jgi:acetyl-CoA synthetase
MDFPLIFLLLRFRSPEGGLNVSYNCLDRHAYANPDKTAIIYEADEPGQAREISYAELLRETCRIANVLKGWGVKKGDTVSIYLPMTWWVALVTLFVYEKVG